LGFCPYVILRHRDNGTPWGDWAYKGSEAPIHRINWRISRQDKSIDRHQFPRWFAAAGGKKPGSQPMGEDDLTYVELAKDTPPPFLQAIVPQIDNAAAQDFWTELRDMLRGAQPELNLNDIRLLSNVSAEAMAQAKQATENALRSVLPNYQHALIRAMQMALSAGFVSGAWDIGNSNPDEAYKSGAEGFDLASYPVLPPTVYDRVQQATADTAAESARLKNARLAQGIVSQDEQLRIAGYSDDQFKNVRPPAQPAQQPSGRLAALTARMQGQQTQ
jgi:hypothetical protein